MVHERSDYGRRSSSRALSQCASRWAICRIAILSQRHIRPPDLHLKCRGRALGNFAMSASDPEGWNTDAIHLDVSAL